MPYNSDDPKVIERKRTQARERARRIAEIYEPVYGMSNNDPNYTVGSYTRDRESRFAYSLRKNYNLTLEQYAAMYAAQNGKCAISGIAKPNRLTINATLARSDILVVDHCHDTDKVRGLICDGINKALGLFDHNPYYLYAAGLYIQEHRDGVRVKNQGNTYFTVEWQGSGTICGFSAST